MGPAPQARVGRGDPSRRGPPAPRRSRRARPGGRRRWRGRSAAPSAPRRSGGRGRSARPRRATRAARPPGRRATCRSACRAGRRSGSRSRARGRPAGSSTGRGRTGSRRRRRSPPSGATFAELAEVRLSQDEPVAVARPEPRLDSGDRRPVGIEAEEAAIRVGRLQDPLGVPTAAQGGVDLKAAGRRREHLEDLLHQHRQVPFLHRSSIPNESDPERILEAHVVGARSPSPSKAEASSCGSSSALPVVVPPVGCPDLRVVARADDDGLAVETDRVAQVGRQQDPALVVHLDLDGAREDESLEEARLLVGDRQRGDLARQRRPSRPWCGSPGRRRASPRPSTPASSWARNFTGTAIRPLSSTVCRYSPVNTCRATPVVAWAGRLGSGASPLLTTLCHFAAF